MDSSNDMCCEHKNCYINFNVHSKDPDAYTYFIVDTPESQAKNVENLTAEERMQKATDEDRVYIFCKIHSRSLLEYLDEIGEVDVDYMESIVKEPHFGTEDNILDTLLGF